MRNFIFQLIIIASALFAGVSCSKEKVTLYTEAPGIYFNGFSTTYNFTEHPENVEIGCDTVNIPFLITGSAMDKERVIKVRLSPEDTITAEESMYELLSGSVPAGSYQGQLQVKINYSPLLDDSVYVTRLRVVATEDFPVTDLNGRGFSLYITNKIGRPANWSQLNNYFGEYSDSWYRFILDATGLPSLPYWSPRGSADPNNPDPERWTMTGTEVKAYAALVKEKLTEYNNEHPGNPLKHEDGEYKEQPVTMP